MDIWTILSSLETTRIGEFIQLSDWAFPAVEVVHVIAIVLVYGVIAIVDLRLLGLAGRTRRYADLAADSLQLVWIAFALAVVTGTLMFMAQATAYAKNPFFLTKMVFIALAGINMLVMEFVISRTRHEWGDGQRGIPVAARIAGALSLSFWTVVVVCGRWIGFTMFNAPF
ncbi:MAG TPA: DUF6644 family protein [Rhizobiaceae bacterium]|nr:DUF6644 family protein [Rhizobiaceae bacterium]